MTDSPRSIDPFANAKRMPTVLVSYRVEDVMDALPKVSKADAEVFVAKHGIVIAQTMLAAAKAVVRKLAEGENDEQ